MVVNSGEVLPEFFSIGSGGSEVSSELCCAHFWLLLGCPLELLVVVLVRFALRTNGALVVLVEVLPEPVVLLLLSAVFSLLAVYLGYVLVRKVGFVSRALWALPDGSLVSSMGVWLVVLLWKCQSHLAVFPLRVEETRCAHCCDLLVESSSLGLDCCMQSARLLLVKVVDFDPVCGLVFGQFAVLFASRGGVDTSAIFPVNSQNKEAVVSTQSRGGVDTSSGFQQTVRTVQE
ncbi:hypothetical protein Taro_021377 [Colocasia esculenta]|uniref:Uncharacterized protein n=1 Tax=Colocasia esculenta TaxID=4460 RepID=A0A843UYP9_COLES|nr:hypothetical protein [Colocasia esculenta]